MFTRFFDYTFKQLTNIVHHNGKAYFVSTNNTFDKGLETMIFKSGMQPETSITRIIDGEKIDWNGIHTKWHESTEDAIAYHKAVVKNIGDYLC